MAGIAAEASSSPPDVLQQIRTLQTQLDALDKQIKLQVSSHHGQLLVQATSIESLEDILETLQQQVDAFKLNVHRAAARVNDVTVRLERQTIQLRRMVETTNLLRSLIRFVNISHKLKQSGLCSSSEARSVAPRELVKQSLMMHEMAELCTEFDPAQLNICTMDASVLPTMQSNLQQLARHSLQHGLVSSNPNLVAQAVQVFINIDCLPDQLNDVLSELTQTVLSHVRNIGKGRSSLADDNTTAASTTTTPAAAAPSSLQMRANLWSDVQRWCDQLLTTAQHCITLHKVLTQKCAQTSTMPTALNDRQKIQLRFENFMSQLNKALAAALDSASLGRVRQALQSEYPRLLRLVADAFSQVANATSDAVPAQHIRPALANMQTAYVTSMAAGLKDAVNRAFRCFSEDSAAGREQCDWLAQHLCLAVQVTAFDATLSASVVESVAAAIHLFGEEAQKLIASVAAVNAADANQQPVITSKHLAAVRHLNAVHYFGRTCAAASYGLPAKSLQPITDELSALSSVVRGALQPLFDIVCRNVAAILLTMHNEDYGKDGLDQQQASPYMRELQSYMVRISREFLSVLECGQESDELRAAAASRILNLFLFHITLIRPLGSGGRLKLTSDMQQIVKVLQPLADSSQQALQPDIARVRLLKAALYTPTADVLTSQDLQVADAVQLFLLLQLLISASPPDLRSAHTTVGWSIAEYVQWYTEQTDVAQRLALIKGALEAYTHRAQEQNESEYCATYPVIVELLQRGYQKFVTAAA